jgi:hypothetical protein
VAYAIFDTPAIHPIPGIKDLTHAGSDMAKRQGKLKGK